jgi:hypothetical protein
MYLRNNRWVCITGGGKISRRGKDYESKLTCDNMEILEKRNIAKNKKALQDYN